MRPPRARTRSTAKARKRSDEAPRHCGSLGGKCAPMSPSASAPRIASISACRTTSASEWPVSAVVVRNAHAAEHDVIAGPNACTSMPEPVRTSPSAASCVASARAKSSGVRELDIAGLALEHADRHAGPFGERGVVGEIIAARAAARRCASSRASKANACGVCTSAQRAAVERLGRRCRRASTILTVSVTGSAGIAAPVLRPPRSRARSGPR